MILRFVRVLSVLLSYYRRHLLQSAFLAIGLITGVALWSAVQLINANARASYAEADQFLGAEAGFWIRDRAGDGVSQDEYISLRRQGFKEIYPVIEARLTTRQGGLVRLVATDLLALPMAGGGAPQGAGNPFASADWLALTQPPFQTWYPASLAQALGIAEGDVLELRGGEQLPPALLQTQDQQGQRVFLDVGAALEVLDRDMVSYLAVGRLSAKREASLRRALPDRLRLVPNRQALDLSELTASLHTNLTALGLLSFAVGLFIVFNAVRFSLVSRAGTLTTLRELGVGTSMLIAAISAESLIWATLGAIVGVIVGLQLADIMLPAVAATVQSLYGANVDDAVGVSLELLLGAWLLTLSGVVLALAVPLWQRARRPVTDGRDGQAIAESSAAKVLAASGVLLLAFGAAAFFIVDTIVGGFIVIASVMFGGTAMLPAVIVGVASLAGRLDGDRWWRWRWAIGDTLSQLPHLRIALMALLLTLIANIGVTTLVGSFRTALSDWLDNRLSANLYVQSDTLDLEKLREQDWLIAAHQRVTTSGRFEDRPATVTGVDPAAPDIRGMELAQSLPGGIEYWQGKGNEHPRIIANEQTHFLGGVDLGETITLDTAQGPQTFEVTGFTHDYGNERYAFLLPMAAMNELFPDAEPAGLALWVADGRLAEATSVLVRAGAEPGDWIEQDEIRRISFVIFDRTFEITAALNGLTLLVAGIALLAGLLAVHHHRLPDYSHWRAMGVRWREWLMIVAVPLLLMAAMTIAFAIPLGLLLSWLLIHQLNVIAFGWTMPMDISWLPVGVLVLLTIGIVSGTLAIAVLRTRQTLPISLKRLTQ